MTTVSIEPDEMADGYAKLVVTSDMGVTLRAIHLSRDQLMALRNDLMRLLDGQDPEALDPVEERLRAVEEKVYALSEPHINPVEQERLRALELGVQAIQVALERLNNATDELSDKLGEHPQGTTVWRAIGALQARLAESTTGEQRDDIYMRAALTLLDAIRGTKK